MLKYVTRLLRPFGRTSSLTALSAVALFLPSGGCERRSVAGDGRGE